MLHTYPFDNPNARSMRKKRESEAMSAVVALEISMLSEGRDGRWMLQARKRGMKNVRRREACGARGFESSVVVAGVDDGEDDEGGGGVRPGCASGSDETCG